MYAYTWDPETGGLLLNSTHQQFSKEPRPVYYRELDILGFDKYFDYDKNDSAPIMWAEANNYIYRGDVIAQTKGGAPFITPKIIISSDNIHKRLISSDINLMIKKNEEILEGLTQNTIKKIYNIYKKYQNKVDLFYVAFSGGKDSVVALDLVQRTLPHNEFKVLFGDTRMEFPDTYDLVGKIKKNCKEMGIDFLVSKSEFDPMETWRKFGPPAQRMRWCCSVHKTAPQILLLRQYLNNPRFRGMAFTGIRAAESTSRSEYEEVSLGQKVRGQYSCHPILEWNSAELFLYIYAEHLLLNDAYKKGNSRAGCLVCPLAGYKNMFFKEQSYSTNTNDHLTTTDFDKIILETSSKEFSTKKDEEEFMNIAGWKARRSGRELNISSEKIVDELDDNLLKVSILDHQDMWKQWLKTVGEYNVVDNNTIDLIWEKEIRHIKVNRDGDKLQFKLTLKGNTKSDILLKKVFKTALRKSAYCIGCHVCESNCPYGYIHMSAGKVNIDNNCVKCRKCHDIDDGCLLANSNRLPKINKKMGSVNRYGNMGIEYNWVRQYFELKDGFWGSPHSLGSHMVKNLKSFLADSEITQKNKFTPFGSLIDSIGIESPLSWGLILVNLATTPEFNWWIKNIEFDEPYTQDSIKDLLAEETGNSKNHIISAFRNILISNEILSKEIGLGVCDYDLKNGKRHLHKIVRQVWRNPIPEVILYSLYRFAEACGDYYKFTLTDLANTNVDRDGVSPMQIFGVSKDDMKKIITGLSANYPDFISASFTLGLDNINLHEDKSSKDVLNLIKK